MQVSSKDIDLVRHSFSRIALEKEKAGQVFYAHLFEIAPEVRPLFVTDIEAQSEKLMNTLGFLVLRLDAWEKLSGDIRDLAERHVGYGVKPQHYALVRDAVIHMVAEMRGPSLTDAERTAWHNTYDAVSSAMIASAYGDGAAGSAQ